MLIFPIESAPERRRREPRALCGAVCKRAIDLVGSAVGLVLLSPLFLLVALAIKLDSRGSIFYTQERVGVNRRRNGHVPTSSGDRRSVNRYGRGFRVYKFRSMVSDAEKGTGPVWAKAGDSRITRVGRLLRKMRLDEFPQLWNVLRGDMSLVGPRPERFFFVRQLEEVIPGYAQRCDVMPGITGLAQVKRGYDSSIESANTKLQYDLYYVRNRQLLLDLKIMAATVKVMARGDGAH
jgi:lipopolysaccharide/colanic/teichoic acid biosynthesis glycosyltransferase